MTGFKLLCREVDVGQGVEEVRRMVMANEEREGVAVHMEVERETWRVITRRQHFIIIMKKKRKLIVRAIVEMCKN